MWNLKIWLFPSWRVSLWSIVRVGLWASLMSDWLWMWLTSLCEPICWTHGHASTYDSFLFFGGPRRGHCFFLNNVCFFRSLFSTPKVKVTRIKIQWLAFFLSRRHFSSKRFYPKVTKCSMSTNGYSVTRLNRWSFGYGWIAGFLGEKSGKMLFGEEEKEKRCWHTFFRVFEAPFLMGGRKPLA